MRYYAHSAKITLELRRLPFSPDDQLAYSVGQDGLVIVRPIGELPIDDVLAFIRDNRVLRDFTCENASSTISFHCVMPMGTRPTPDLRFSLLVRFHPIIMAKADFREKQPGQYPFRVPSALQALSSAQLRHASDSSSAVSAGWSL